MWINVTALLFRECLIFTKEGNVIGHVSKDQISQVHQLDPVSYTHLDVYKRQCMDDEEFNTTAASKVDDSSSRMSYSIQSSSVFSKSRNTHGTGASSTLTGGSQDKKAGDRDAANIGKPLRVVDFGRLSSLNPVLEEEDSIGTGVSAEEGSVRGSRGNSRSCLLYTSRCV